MSHHLSYRYTVSEGILFYVALCISWHHERKKPTIRTIFTLINISIDQEFFILYIGHYHRKHCTLDAFEQLCKIINDNIHARKIKESNAATMTSKS